MSLAPAVYPGSGCRRGEGGVARRPKRAAASRTARRSAQRSARTAPDLFASGRQFAAWMGLTPKDHSTGGKVRMGVITRAGDEMLRKTLVVGATSVLNNVRTGRGKDATPWLTELLKRKPPKLAAIAFANKIARIAWKIMTSGETYRKQATQPPMACAA